MQILQRFTAHVLQKVEWIWFIFKQKIIEFSERWRSEEEVDGMQEVRGSDPFKGGEITYFSHELWWIFARSPLSLAVNLHNFTAFTAFHRKITYEICVEKTNFSPLILHIFAFCCSTRGQARRKITFPTIENVLNLEQVAPASSQAIPDLNTGFAKSLTLIALSFIVNHWQLHRLIMTIFVEFF